MTAKKPLVFLGMSGGVDSSVAALLLVEAGFEVHGVHLRLWSPVEKMEESRQTLERFEQVCTRLGLTHETLDYRESFKQTVIDYYVKELRAGRTPNPCVQCNRQIKWGALLDYALAHGADYLASGHYAILKRSTEGLVSLYKARDTKKDQSYFLSALNQDTFRHMLFPLGEYTKSEVRAKAIAEGLPDFSRLDSQDLCFLEAGGQVEFLKRYAPESLQSGPIRTADGRLVGEHQGLPLYTIGQRKGIRVAAAEPFFVARKDVEKNTLYIDTSDHLGKDTILGTDLNWISGVAPDLTKPYQVKIRSGAVPVLGSCCINANGDIIVRLEKPLRDITAGQRLVIFDRDLCLGSAEIIDLDTNEITEVGV